MAHRTLAQALLVDLQPVGGNKLLRVSGMAEELTEPLGTRVDVMATSLR
jgi:predicted nucleotidyltransferase